MPIRSLIFCTAHARSHLLWTVRYRRWLDAVLGAQLGADQILLVDDGSPVLPGWVDTPVCSGTQPADAAHFFGHAGPLLFHFTDNLGRRDILNFPGWHRSFSFAVAYAQAAGFDRVIHLESDAYLVSLRMRALVRDHRSGWTTFWARSYEFPEMAIQLVGPDQLASLAALAAAPYSGMAGRQHEWALPYTEVNRDMIGDRYGETDQPVPAVADFASQIPSQREPDYYWWLQPGAPGPTPPLAAPVTFTFGRDGNAAAHTLDGWAKPEARQQWMVGGGSVFLLPALLPDVNYNLVLLAVPYLAHRAIQLQRLMIHLNQVLVAEFDLTNTQTIGCALPDAVLRRDGTDRLRVTHPDAASPLAKGESQDARLLAVALRRLQLVPAAGGPINRSGF